jgi:hypothetical protein
MGAATTRCRGWTSSGLGDGCGCTEEDEDVGQWVLDLGRDWCGACPGAPLDSGAWLGALASGACPAMADPETDQGGELAGRRDLACMPL